MAFVIISSSFFVLITKGSDHHGPVVKPNIMLATGINNNIVKNEEEFILSRLLKRVK